MRRIFLSRDLCISVRLQERMSTRHIPVSKHELFSAEDLVEGDYIVFARESVAIVLVYGRKTKEYKMVVIE